MGDAPENQDIPAENTLLAFARALVEGAAGVETDVRLSQDGRVVIAHDVDLARVTDGEDTRAVQDLSAAELGQVRLARAGAIPTLDEALAWAMSKGTLVNVEIKHDVPNRLALARAVASSLVRSRAESFVVASSFDPLLLALLAPLAPKVPRALLLHQEHPQGRRNARLALRLPRTFVHALHFEGRMITPALADVAKARGITVGAWTINDEAEAARLTDLGVSSLITDIPGRLRARENGAVS